MSVINSQNERIKRRYLHRMVEADGLAPQTVDAAARSIADFEKFTDGKDFRAFSHKDALGYKKHVLSKGGKQAAELSNRSTVQTRLRHVQRFFRWLSGEPGFKSRIHRGDVGFLSLSRRDVRLANEAPEKSSPTLEQVQHVIRSMPATNAVEKRNRAMVAFILLTGVRVSACISLKLKHVRADQQGIDQDAMEVHTKLGKSHTVFFFPVGDDIREMFLEYVQHLKQGLLWGDDAPLFGRTRKSSDNGSFHGGVIEPRHWATPDPLRRIAREAFEQAGVIYHSPHSIRRTLTRLGERRCKTFEQMKAWSQNLGHDEVLTTLTSYGGLPLHDQAKILASFPEREESGEIPVAELMELIRRSSRSAE